MQIYTAYEPDTGKIRAQFSGITSFNGLPHVMGRFNEETHRICLTTLVGVPRPEFPVSAPSKIKLGASIFLYPPLGTILTHEGNQYVIENGKVELQPDHAGLFAVKLSLWPYIDKTLTIEVTE